MHIFKDTKYDFLRWRWHALVLSWVIILAGIFVLATKGIQKGVEFAGGTVVITEFTQPTSVEQVRSSLDRSFRGGDVVVQAYGDPSRNQVRVRVPSIGVEKGQGLSATKDAVVAALQKSNLGEFKVVGSEIVGPTVGAELTSKGVWATALSLVGILAYLAFRFQFSFGVGAVVATMHDLLVTLAFLAFFRYDMSLNVIAAILTMTGFSTNDTIVIFDRIRENLRVMRRDSMYDVINASVNQTLGRTIITSGTALLTSLALLFFGGEVLHGFAFTMVVGIITGTYSSVFIAAAIVSFWRGTSPTRAAAHAPASVSGPQQAPAPQQPTRKTKAQRKARAS
jgi:preprotein translocase subunit SecF